MKIRAFDIRRKKMFYEIGEGTAEVIAVGVNETLRLYNEDPNWEVMLFLRMQDKNNKDVYEGDIASHRPPNQNLTTGVVSFSPSQGVLIGNQPAGFEVQVVGNIYENPELLK